MNENTTTTRYGVVKNGEYLSASGTLYYARWTDKFHNARFFTRASDAARVARKHNAEVFSAAVTYNNDARRPV